MLRKLNVKFVFSLVEEIRKGAEEQNIAHSNNQSLGLNGKNFGDSFDFAIPALTGCR
jgi:hypothetical protein